MRSLVVAGPTASGKTELSLVLAKKLGAEIISADSRQVYRGLTVGTAKPAGTWQNGVYQVDCVAYHLVDCISPKQTFDASAFCQQTQVLLDSKPTKPFIFTGGTGLYIQAFFMGLDPLPAANAALRAELTSFVEKHGKQALHDRLAQVDVVSAQQIPPGNLHRVMRALEISLLSGQPASTLRKNTFQGIFPTEKALFVYLNWDKELLNKRIEQRTAAMLEGMAQETNMLLNQGFAPDCPALKSLGYAQILEWINGSKTRQETLEKIITLTRQYAKRQRTWFNRYQNILRIDLHSPQDFDVETLANKIIHAYTGSAAQH